MIIKPIVFDDDDYDKNTVRYYTEIDDDGYFYECYVLVDGKKAAIVITDNGVNIDFDSGECLGTNITPERLFPNDKSLSWKQIRKIIRILEKIDGEGKLHSKEYMDAKYEEWKTLTRYKESQ